MVGPASFQKPYPNEASTKFCPLPAQLEQGSAQVSQFLQLKNRQVEKLCSHRAVTAPSSSTHAAICKSAGGSHRTDAQPVSPSPNLSRQTKRSRAYPYYFIPADVQHQEPRPAWYAQHKIRN